MSAALSQNYSGWRANPDNARLDMYYDGTLITSISDCGIALHTGTGIVSAGGTFNVDDNALFGIGTGNTSRLSYDTTDANANAVMWQLPAGGGTDVPVIVIGPAIESVDFALYNGVVDTKVVLLGDGAVTTGPTVDFRSSRGTAGSPSTITAGDDLGSINAYGRGSTTWRQSHRILFESDGTIGANRVPSSMLFQTATDACASVLTTALTIGKDQLVTAAAGFTVTAGNVIVTAGNVTLTCGNLLVSCGTIIQTAGDITATLGDFVATDGTLFVSDGGAVTQCTNKATTVVLNEWAGQVTMNAACLAAGVEANFTVTNDKVAIQDVPVVAIQSGGTPGEYMVGVSRVAADGFDITISNMSAGCHSDAVIINYVILKGSKT